MRAAIYRGVWCAVWTEGGKTRRISLRMGGRPQDRSAAEQEVRRLLARPTGDTVADLMDAYLAEKDHSAAAPQRLRDAWKALAPTFGPLLPQDIDRPLCRRYVAQRRQQGRQDGTIRKELGTLRSGLAWHGIAATIDMPSAPPPRDRYLTRDEYEALVAGAGDPHIRLFIILAVATAGRASAILDLTWDRVDFDRGRIDLRVDGPGKGRAIVPMTNQARAALTAAREGALSDYVIEYAGRKVGSVKKGFATACARAGLEGVTPHVLRHTAAVWMAEAGVPMPVIAQYLGHRDSRITERVYARYSPDYLAQAAQALEAC